MGQEKLSLHYHLVLVSGVLKLVSKTEPSGGKNRKIFNFIKKDGGGGGFFEDSGGIGCGAYG